jgi:hypothetical protein
MIKEHSFFNLSRQNVSYKKMQPEQKIVAGHLHGHCEQQRGQKL